MSKNSTGKYKENRRIRDKAMLDRFNYLYKVEKKRLDFVWETLESEFFIGRLQIQRRLKDYSDNYIKDGE